jgi:hypothetical protein
MDFSGLCPNRIYRVEGPSWLSLERARSGQSSTCRQSIHAYTAYVDLMKHRVGRANWGRTDIKSWVVSAVPDVPCLHLLAMGSRSTSQTNASTRVRDVVTEPCQAHTRTPPPVRQAAHCPNQGISIANAPRARFSPTNLCFPKKFLLGARSRKTGLT